MKKMLTTLFTGLLPLLACAHLPEKSIQPDNTHTPDARNMAARATGGGAWLLQNKGQITDQYGNARRDIDFKLQAGGIMVFGGNGEFHYQWCRPGNGQNPDADMETYRMDVVLDGADKRAVAEFEQPLPYGETHYKPKHPAGIVVPAYGKVVYRNIYPHIDWVIYVAEEPTADKNKKNTRLKYDFVVHPGGDPSLIKMRYAGATTLGLDQGAVVAATPIGRIREQAPFSYEAATGREVASAFTQSGNTIGFATAKYGPGDLVIDPNITLEWSTYFGGTGREVNLGDIPSGGTSQRNHNSAFTADEDGNVFMAGGSNSAANIATAGGYQNMLAGNFDGFLAKFNERGALLWATYYGGSAFDGFGAAACDKNGNIFVGGHTRSTGLGTTGTYQSSAPGATDGLVVKFGPGGSRLWATYYGGSDTEVITAMACDKNGDLFIAGGTGSANGIATTHQTTIGGGQTNNYIRDAFIAKLSGTGGQRLWGTYYGGDSMEIVQSIACDSAGNVYAGGATGSLNNISTPLSHLATANGNSANISASAYTHDAFLVKFSGSGVRQWATYYGGNGEDVIYVVACDKEANVYIGGFTRSTSSISTAGRFNSTPPSLPGGFSYGFLAKFNPTGQRQWGTYLGTNHSPHGLQISREGNIYLAGYAPSSTSPVNIATADAYRNTNAGASDAFLMELDATGTNLLYGTYWGGSSYETSTNLALGAHGRVYIGGITNSNNGIATTGAYQTNYGGPSTISNDGDAFVTSFLIDTMVYFKPPYADTLFCAGDSLHIRYGVNRKFRNGNIFTLQLSDDTGGFTAPVSVGSIATNDSGIIHTKLPYNIKAGKGYRLRIAGSNPVRYSYPYPADIRIKPVAGNFSASVNGPVCAGDTLKLTGASDSAGVTWAWEGPNAYADTSRDSFIAVSEVNMSGDYILTATLDGCHISDTVTAEVKPLPNKPNASAGTTALCEGATLSLLASSTTTGVSYSWSGPGGFTSGSAAPTRTAMIPAWTGNYVASAILNGCPSRDTVYVLVYPTPAKPTAGSNSPVCVGGSLNLTASTVTGATYEWSGPATFGTTQQNPTRQNVLLTYGGKYSVVAKMNGCTSLADTATVVVNAGPQVGMYPNPGDTICTGWDVTFTATPQNAGANPTFDWYRNGAFTGNSGLTYKTNAVSHGDTFTVRMTSSACNTAIASKPVRMNVLPTQDPPAISIAATPGTHVWPLVEVTFKATTTKAGAKPGYQWKRNGADIPNGKDSILKMTDLKAGDTVCCVVTSNFLCAEPREVTSNCLLMNVDLSIGNQGKSTTGLRLYPNPTTGSFTLETEDAGTLVISNLQGQHIADYEVAKGINRITLPQGIAAGVYVGKLGNEVVRLVVE